MYWGRVGGDLEASHVVSVAPLHFVGSQNSVLSVPFALIQADRKYAIP